MRTMMREQEDRPTGPLADGYALSCEEFQDQMAQLMENEMVDIHDHPHLRTCARCTALLDELEQIGDAAKELLTPTYEPSDKLLDRIRESIFGGETDAKDSKGSPLPGERR